MATLPGVGASTPTTFADQAVIDAAAALATAQRVESVVTGLAGRKHAWVVGLIMLAASPTGLAVYERFRAPPPPPPALTSEDASLIRLELKSLRLTVDDQSKAIRELERAQDRQTGAAMARQPSPPRD